jgi:hypothetical protein
MLITKTLEGLHNGISQQVPDLRLGSQSEADTNTLCTLSKGLKRRPSTHSLMNIEGAYTKCKLHPVYRDSEEKYLMAVMGVDDTDETMFWVYDTDGNSIPYDLVEFSSGDPMDFTEITGTGSAVLLQLMRIREIGRAHV